LSSLTLKNEIPLCDKTGRDSGEKTYPIWLLVNPKYTAVRYDVWRPVLDECKQSSKTSNFPPQTIQHISIE